MILINKDNGDDFRKCEAITITEETLFTTEGDAKATITPPDHVHAVIFEHSYHALVAGEYKLCLQGECRHGVLHANPVMSTSAIVLPQACFEVEGKGMMVLSPVIKTINGVEFIYHYDIEGNKIEESLDLVKCCDGELE